MELYEVLTDRVYGNFGVAPGEASWSEALELLVGQLAARPGLEDHAILAVQAYATSLDREGRRGDAIAALTGALERYPEKGYSIYLRLDLGMFLRDEHEFGRALTELRSAKAQIDALRGRDLDRAFASNLRMFDALVASELGAAAETLGMTDSAAESFERADELASALDNSTGPAVYGGNLMYRLNFAVNQGRWSEVRALRSALDKHPWRDRLPERTAREIRERFAIAEVGAAFRGEAAPGAGETELRALIELGLAPEEELRATAFLVESLLDRGAEEAAGEALAAASELLAVTQGQEPRRLHVLGLSARYLRATGAGPEQLSAFLSDELRPGFEGFLEAAQRGPLEEAGISLLYNDWLRAALCELFEFELATGHLGAERAFDCLARLHAVGTFAREHGIDAPTLADVRAALLAPRRGLLAYVPGRGTSYVFALDDGPLAIHRLGPAYVLDAKARDLAEAIQSVIGAPNEHSEARLAAALAAATDAFVPIGIADCLERWSSVAVVGLDDFGYLPFEALQPSGREALGITHEVTYQPSVAVGVWLATRAAARAQDAGPAIFYIGQGDPARGGHLDLAPVHVNPARLGVAAFVRAEVPWKLLGPEMESGLASELAGAHLAAILAHGVYDSERVRPAGLLLAPEEEDGAWFAESLETLPRVPAVIIAACNTDRAPLRRGDDGRGHLRASFFRCGSDCVTTATLALDLEGAIEMLAHVNARLAAGDSVAAALHSARRADQPRGVHPVHAHLLHVFGAGDMRPFPLRTRSGTPSPGTTRSSKTWWWMIAGAAGLLALAALRGRPTTGRSSPG